LKDIAQRATQGEWWIDSHGEAMVAFTDEGIFEVFTSEKPEGVEPTRHADTGNLSYWRNDNDATHIAAACPETVLKLITEIERLKAICGE
jgi:hypothetical protein